MGFTDVVEEHIQQRLALKRMHILDVRGKTTVHEQDFLAGFWVGDNNRVFVPRISITLRGRHGTYISAEKIISVMLGISAF